jgi:hypothetical protein
MRGNASERSRSLARAVRLNQRTPIPARRTDTSETPKVPLRSLGEGPSSAWPALAGQRDLRAVIDVGGIATKCLRAALRELAETPEPLHFRLLVHDNSLAIGASGSIPVRRCRTRMVPFAPWTLLDPCQGIGISPNNGRTSERDEYVQKYVTLRGSQ